MAALQWDLMAERFFETGVSNGVLYSPVAGVYSPGVVWNGLTAVTQSPSGAEANPMYADNIKYVNLISKEEFAATIEAFTFPDAFLKHDGVLKTTAGMQVAQQGRPIFGFSWQTKKGNALDEDLGFIVNLAYGCQAAPSEKAHNTVNESPELTTMSWALTTTPVSVTGFKPTAIIKIDSTDPDVDPDGLELVLDQLYGRAAVVNPNLPLPDAVDALLTVV